MDCAVKAENRRMINRLCSQTSGSHTCNSCGKIFYVEQRNSDGTLYQPGEDAREKFMTPKQIESEAVKLCDEYVITGMHHCSCHGAHAPQDCTHGKNWDGKLKTEVGPLGLLFMFIVAACLVVVAVTVLLILRYALSK